MDARNVDVLVNMALVEKTDRLPQQAQELLLRAVGIQPTHAVAHYNLGLLYEEAGNRGQAADEYGEFLKYAGPEHGALLSDVRDKIDALMPRTPPR
jgi:tetratricopeptide (TPR) repeat protein